MAYPASEHFIRPDWPAPANIAAFCTTREGGHSGAPFDDYNLGHHVGDDLAAVTRNRERLASDLPGGAVIQWLTQVHGSTVVAAAGAAVEHPEADASWSRQPGQVCAVLTADCLPILLCSRQGDAVGAVHVGWRGLLGGVIEACLEALAIAPAHTLAWLGPAIGPNAFEVGAELRAQFLSASAVVEQAAVAACFVPLADREEHYYADLYRLAKLRLKARGVTAIYGGDLCTFSDPQRFFSYRRDGQTGRMASVIVCEPV